MKLSLTNKLAVGAVFLLAVTNPFIIPYVNNGVNWFFDRVVFANSGTVMAISGTYLAGIYFYKEYKSSKIKLPKMGKLAKNHKKDGLKYEAQA